MRFTGLVSLPLARCLGPALSRHTAGLVLISTTLILAGCSSAPSSSSAITVAPGLAEQRSAKTSESGLPKGGGIYKVGNPYTIKGRLYIPQEDPDYDQTGIASWYGSAFHGKMTANGETFDMNALTAGHPTLPMPIYAFVTNLGNGRTIMVRINDRGPYVTDRIIDLSARAAHELGFSKQGLARVRVRYAGKAPLDGDDTAERKFLLAQAWHQGQSGTQVASLSGIDSLLDSLGWSVVSYRRKLVEPDGTVQRSGLLGRETLLEVGPFSSRSEAERMCHDLSEYGPAVVEPYDRSSPETTYQVRAGPYRDEKMQTAAESIASAGSDSQ